MNKEFIPYEQALALKELGFDEPCIAFYKDNNNLKAVDQHWGNSVSGISKQLGYHIDDLALAPTYQSVFRWFREKHGLHSSIGFDSWHTNEYMLDIVKEGDKDFHYDDPTLYNTYEDAQLACLNKLIELI